MLFKSYYIFSSGGHFVQRSETFLALLVSSYDMYKTSLVKNEHRGKTWKIRKGKQPFLYVTCRTDIIHIPIKFLEDIPKVYRVMVCKRLCCAVV